MTSSRGEQEAAIDTVTTPPALVECTNVSRTFGSGPTAVHAVRDVNCRIPPWARIAVTGPSGSGKSTLLHLIAGLDAPTAGSVRWPALEDSPHATAIGMVFQGPSLLPSLDVTENVALPMLFAGQAHDAAMSTHTRHSTCSGSATWPPNCPRSCREARRSGSPIARVLAARPALILADEPTGQLDHHHADKVITVLLDTAISIGAAVIISTHDPAVAARLPDHWVMRDGHLDTHPDTDDSSAP